MKRRIIIVVVLLILLGLGGLWYYLQQSHESIKAPKPQTQLVRVAKVEMQTVPHQVDAVGVLKAKRRINVAPQLPGQIVSITYQPGAFVKEGTRLIQLDDRIYRANLKSSKAAFKLAQINYHRYRSLAKQGVLAKQMLDKMRATFQEAQAKVSELQTTLSQTTIRAPFDGYVGAKMVSIGDYVEIGKTLTTLTDRSYLQVDYSLPEKYLSVLKLGQLVTLYIPNQKDKSFHGVVSYIAPTIDISTHSIALEAEVANPKNILTPGLFVRIRQRVGIARNALVVPQTSIVPTITGDKVFVVVKGKARTRKVRIGVTVGNKVQIIKGLSLGDVVITAGQQHIKDGSPVKIESR